jgi:quercetin dioxygenase-like cupin family protein
MIILPGANPETPAERATNTFSGEVFAHPVQSAPGVRVASILFTPCSRTYWHSHENGQILYVTAGIGRVCALGETPQIVRAGDVVWTAPGETHWHGADPSSFMSHLAISLGATQWADEVIEADYTATPGQTPTS